MAQEYGAFDLSTLAGAKKVTPQQGTTAVSGEDPLVTAHTNQASGQTAGLEGNQNYPTEVYAPEAEPSSMQSGGENLIPGELIRSANDETFTEVMQLSAQVPMVIDLWAQWCSPCKQLSPILEELTQEYAGRFGLVKVDVDAAPGLAQAFQAQSIPTVVALLAGRPVPLFQGAQPKSQIKALLDQLLEISAQAGINGVLAGDSLPATPSVSPEEIEIDQLLQDGDLPGAITRAQKALRNNPAEKSKYQRIVDQLELQQRLSQQAESTQADPLTLADQFFANGNYPLSFQILIEQISSHQAEEREPYRQRLLELFRLCEDQETVKKTRAELAKLLF